MQPALGSRAQTPARVRHGRSFQNEKEGLLLRQRTLVPVTITPASLQEAERETRTREVAFNLNQRLRQELALPAVVHLYCWLLRGAGPVLASGACHTRSLAACCSPVSWWQQPSLLCALPS